MDSVLFCKEIMIFKGDIPLTAYYKNEWWAPPGMPRYLKQLTEKCTNPACLKIFCRQIDDLNMAEDVAKVLSRYGNSLLCKKIEKSLFESEQPDGNQIIDMYFYILNAICKPERKTPISTPKGATRNASKDIVCRTRNESKAPSKMFKSINTSDRKRSSAVTRSDSYKIKPCQDFNHSFCHVNDKQLKKIDSYLLKGVLHLLLWKFHNNPDFNLALVITRLFNSVLKTSTIDNCYFSVLIDVFDVIREKVCTSVIPLVLLDTHDRCPASVCLFHFNFTKKDFLACFHAFKRLIEQSSTVDIRFDEGLAACFEIFQKIYQINQTTGLIEEKEFVLIRFFSKINIKNELKFTKIRYSSSLNYHFAVPICLKADVLKTRNGDLMKSTLQDAFFRALFEGITEPYLFISIRRDFIYRDTLKLLSKTDDDEMKKQLKVKFFGEEGIDSGGIKKEFFLILGHEIANDTNSFVQTNNRIWFKKDVNLHTLRLIGKIIGIALYNDVVLNVPFPAIIFKKLLGIPLNFEELKEIEPEIYSSLINLEKCNENDLDFVDQYFCIDADINGKVVSHELVPHGSQVKVNLKNIKKFQKLYARFLTEVLIEDEFRAFADGFNSIIKYESIQNFQPYELEKIIMGLDDYDFEAIKNTTTYNGYDPDKDAIIGHFWDFFVELTIHKKKKLIQFITGNDRLPVGGSRSLNLVIMRNGCDTDRLPSSQTCFNTLLLPEYSTREKLRKKLSKAINLTAGFFLM